MLLLTTEVEVKRTIVDAVKVQIRAIMLKATTTEVVVMEVEVNKVEEEIAVTSLNAYCVANLDIMSMFATISLIFPSKEVRVQVLKLLVIKEL